MGYVVRFEPWGRDVEVAEGRTLLDAARDARVPMRALCGGRGTCGKCDVRIIAGPIPEPTEREAAVLGRAALEQGRRLACSYRVTAPVTVELFPVLVRGKTGAPPSERIVAAAPGVRRATVELDPPTLEDAVDDAGRLRAALSGPVTSIDWRAARALPTVLRACRWRAEAAVRGNEIIAVRPPGRPPLGCAVDLGTTNIAVYLHRLDTGSLETTCGAPDPLAPWGADIVTRLASAAEAPERGDEMRRVLARGVNLLVERACHEAGCVPDDIDEMVVVGNSGMHHLFLDLPGGQLVRAPYVPALRDPVAVKARDLGIAIAEGGYVYVPGLVGGFIGSDLLAVALATRLDRKPGVRLALDIGTNTELLLSVDGALSSCSTASGPALEGAALRFGSVAADGAVDRVALESPDGRLAVHTIGGGPATGICGSGILDALACLRLTGAVNRSGRLQEGGPGVVTDPEGDRRFVVVPAGANALGVDLTISQMEIRQLQLAKGAIRAGIDTLLALSGAEPADLAEIVVAGTFGSRISVESSVRIGLFPHLAEGAIRQVGNAAGLGASFMLLSEEERRDAEALRGSIRYVELGRERGFMRRFAEAQWFPEEA